MANETVETFPAPALPPAAAPRRRSWKRHLLTLIKLAIAVAGIYLVARSFTWQDTGTIPAGEEIRTITFLQDTPVEVLSERTLPALASRPDATGPATMPREVVLVRFPSAPVRLEIDGKEYTLPIEEHTRLTGSVAELNLPREMELPLDWLKVEKGQRIHQGFHALLLATRSRWYFLLAAWLVLITPFFVTAIRWRNLMLPQGIKMSLPTALRLTFVGQFWSILLPGITGGDLVKIVYASRLTGSKTKSFITVILDRVIGLVALMVIAGAAAGSQLLLNHSAGKPLDPTLLRVLIFILAGLAGLGGGALVYFSHRLRRATGLARILAHPRMPEFVRHIDEVLHAYRHHAGLLAWAFLISLASQFTLPLSASLAGMAFGMHLSLTYYLAYVPVAVLASSLPISPPQGFGLLDGIIYHFFVNRGPATASQAIALAQAVRFLPILWNLVGAYWVIRGAHSGQQRAIDVKPVAADALTAPRASPSSR
ncbi:MAG TPA: lysylphosphatidylglycerol synthase transmembrane domain-containing protein [Phycisphaerae bacterium]|nr:lysylphosphatidylglycerol synthase transmembrane domain-containing protein [Phycisphaerae bacterium]